MCAARAATIPARWAAMATVHETHILIINRLPATWQLLTPTVFLHHHRHLPHQCCRQQQVQRLASRLLGSAQDWEYHHHCRRRRHHRDCVGSLLAIVALQYPLPRHPHRPPPFAVRFPRRDVVWRRWEIKRLWTVRRHSSVIRLFLLYFLSAPIEVMLNSRRKHLASLPIYASRLGFLRGRRGTLFLF